MNNKYIQAIKVIFIIQEHLKANKIIYQMLAIIIYSGILSKLNKQTAII
jgi:hypothetical protein